MNAIFQVHLGTWNLYIQVHLSTAALLQCFQIIKVSTHVAMELHTFLNSYNLMILTIQPIFARYYKSTIMGEIIIKFSARIHSVKHILVIQLIFLLIVLYVLDTLKIPFKIEDSHSNKPLMKELIYLYIILFLIGLVKYKKTA